MQAVRNGVEADDVGADAVMTDNLAEFGDCGGMVDVVSEDRGRSGTLWGA